MDAGLIWLHTALLASVRLTIGLAMTPLFSAFGVPALVRVIMVMAFAGLAAYLAPGAGAGKVLAVQQVGAGFMAEAAIGLLIGMGVHAAFAAFAIAGRTMDMQMGFSLGAALDPVSKGHSAVMASGLNMLAVLLFFVSDAYHLLFSGIFRTFELLPIGQAVPVQSWLPAAEGAGLMFAYGFVMAAPVVVALLLADVVVAVVSRNLPQMNVLFLSIPIKLLLGLAVMSVAVRLLGPIAQKVLALPLVLIDKVQ